MPVKKTIRAMNPISYNFLYNKDIANQLRDVEDALSMDANTSQIQESGANDDRDRSQADADPESPIDFYEKYKTQV